MDHPAFDIGDFRIDRVQRRLFDRDGRPIALPSRAFDVLLFMVQRPGDLIDKASLMRAVWPDTVVEDGNLTQCIFTLRRVLGESPGEHKYIVTVPGRGYQFVAPVRIVTDAAKSHDPGVAQPAPPPNSAPISPTVESRTARSTLLIAGAGVLAGVLAIGLWFWSSAERQEVEHPKTLATSAGVTPSAPQPVTIAVLPFEDLSAAKDMEYFGDGLAEELMSNLAKDDGLRVTGRRSAYSFKNTRDDAQAIGAKLQVQTLLEGSVRKDGKRIRISAQLTRTKDSVTLWADSYDRELDDVLDIQGSISRDVVAALAPVLERRVEIAVGKKPGAGLTSDAEAYRAYLRGVHLLTRWYDRDPAPARIEFLRAVKRDPGFAKAYAMLARTYQLSAMLSMGDIAENKSQAAAALDKALKLDPSIRDLWWVNDVFFEDFDAPLSVQAKNGERTVAANPTEIEPMLWLAHNYLVLARPKDALRLFDRAYSTDPLSPNAIWNEAWFGYVYRGDRQRLLDLSDEMERLLPRDAKPSWTRANLAFNEGRALDWDRFVARIIEVDPTDLLNHAWVSLDYSALGVFDAARYHSSVCSRLDSQGTACIPGITRTALLSGDLSAAQKTVLDAIKRNPRIPAVLFAQAELQYFTGECASEVRIISELRPYYVKAEAAMNLFHDNDHVPMFAWCLRQQGETARVAQLSRVFNTQYAPAVADGMFESLRARMAAAIGDRDALVVHLTALSNTRNMDLAFVRHEPMIQPFLKDAEVAALLDKLEERRTEWRRILPKASMRVSVPAVRKQARS